MHKLKCRKNKTSLLDAHEERFSKLPNDGISLKLSKYQKFKGQVEFKKGEGRKNPYYHITSKTAIGKNHNKVFTLDKMYDYNPDTSVLIPNYKDIKFGTEDRWNN